MRMWNAKMFLHSFIVTKTPEKKVFLLENKKAELPFHGTDGARTTFIK